MKAALILSIVLAGLLSVAIHGAAGITCGCHMTTTHCAPCNQVCNELPRPCPLFCTLNEEFCKCEPGFLLPTTNSNYCIPEKKCPHLSPQ